MCHPFRLPSTFHLIFLRAYLQPWLNLEVDFNPFIHFLMELQEFLLASFIVTSLKVSILAK